MMQCAETAQSACRHTGPPERMPGVRLTKLSLPTDDKGKPRGPAQLLRQRAAALEERTQARKLARSQAKAGTGPQLALTSAELSLDWVVRSLSSAARPASPPASMHGPGATPATHDSAAARSTEVGMPLGAQQGSLADDATQPNDNPDDGAEAGGAARTSPDISMHDGATDAVDVAGRVGGREIDMNIDDV